MGGWSFRARGALIGAAWLAALVATAPARAEPSDVFSSQALGLELTKPHGWVFMSADGAVQSADAVPVDEAGIKRALGKAELSNLLLIAKYREPFADLNPSVVVAVVSGMTPMNPKFFIDVMVENPQPLTAVPPDGRLVEPIRAVTLAGADAAYFRVEYVARPANGPAIPTTNEVWTIPRGDYLLLIQTYARQDEGTGRRADLDAIVDTLKLTPLPAGSFPPPTPPDYGGREPLVTLEKPSPPATRVP